MENRSEQEAHPWTQQRGKAKPMPPHAVTPVVDGELPIARARRRIARATRRRNRSLACMAIVAAGAACKIGILFAWAVSPLWGASKKFPSGWEVFVVIVASGTPLMLSILWANKIKRRPDFEFGMCNDCGYDLRGRSEGSCPECGSLTQRQGCAEHHVP